MPYDYSHRLLVVWPNIFQKSLQAKFWSTELQYENMMVVAWSASLLVRGALFSIISTHGRVELAFGRGGALGCLVF